MARQISTTPTPVDPDEQFDYDLDALVVEEEDAPPFSFQWGGKRFEMPLMMGMAFSDQLALEAATVEQSMSLIMGDSFQDLLETKGVDGRALSIGRMKKLIEAWHAHQGLEPGESQASQRSSGNTARQSRRTSRSARR